MYCVAVERFIVDLPSIYLISLSLSLFFSPSFHPFSPLTLPSPLPTFPSPFSPPSLSLPSPLPYLLSLSLSLSLSLPLSLSLSLPPVRVEWWSTTVWCVVSPEVKLSSSTWTSFSRWRCTLCTSLRSRFVQLDNCCSCFTCTILCVQESWHSNNGLGLWCLTTFTRQPCFFSRLHSPYRICSNIGAAKN